MQDAKHVHRFTNEGGAFHFLDFQITLAPANVASFLPPTIPAFFRLRRTLRWMRNFPRAPKGRSLPPLGEENKVVTPFVGVCRRSLCSLEDMWKMEHSTHTIRGNGSRFSVSPQQVLTRAPCDLVRFAKEGRKVWRASVPLSYWSS